MAKNLYRSGTRGGYYGFGKPGDKQFRRSRKTKDGKLADRRLAEDRAPVGNLTLSENAYLVQATAT